MDAKSALDDQVGKVIEEHLPKIKEIIQEKVAPEALAAVQNDEMMGTLLTPVYKLLPLPVRLVIKKDVFLKFCFDNRDRLTQLGQK